MVEVDCLAELVDDLGTQRIDADEQPLEQLPVRQRVTACIALDAVVAAHDHDRRFLTRARHGIPRDPQRRIEWENVAARLDGCDPHARLLAAVERVP